jgi:N-acetylglucosamine-6-phosphate deacetylase
LLGLEKQVGALSPGAHADIVICDRHGNVQQVFVGGERVYEGASGAQV